MPKTVSSSADEVARSLKPARKQASMTPESFKAWRQSLDLKQKDAAEKLGLKKRVIQYYEKGDRDGKHVEIPKTVELACLALSLGHEGYDGSPLAPPIANGKAAKSPKAAKKPAADDKEAGGSEKSGDES